MLQIDEQDFPQPCSEWKHMVSYGETDAMAVAYYGNYLHWFEQARSDFLRKQGFSYSEIENQGLMLPVREAYCRYRSPARFDQQIGICTAIGKWSRASLTFFYLVYNHSEQSRLMSKGYTEHACVNTQGRPVAVPDWLREMLGRT
ncbi:MAG: thioesterase family protein [Desulfohalobiaceae bacterium]